MFGQNGGQASACNAGFRASMGEVVIFLDADDVLLPETAGRVVRAFGSRPGVAKVQYRQRVVDANGIFEGALQPPATVCMISEDLSHRMLEFNGYPWPSTTGNALAASVLRQILPTPEEVYRPGHPRYTPVQPGCPPWARSVLGRGFFIGYTGTTATTVPSTRATRYRSGGPSSPPSTTMAGRRSFLIRGTAWTPAT